MASEFTERFRLQLMLGKYPVVSVEGQKIKVAMGGTTTMTFTVPDQADVRLGDLLTFYTEVLTKDFPYAPTVFTRQ